MFTGDKTAHFSTSAGDRQSVDTLAVGSAAEFVAVAADVLSDGLMQSEPPLVFRAAVAHG